MGILTSKRWAARSSEGRPAACSGKPRKARPPGGAALATTGHDVLAAVPSDFVDVVRAERLSAHGIAAQARTATERQDMRRRFEALEPRARIPAIVGNFVRVAEDGLDEIDALCASVAPDVILRESMAFAGWVLGAMRACPVIVLDVFPRSHPICGLPCSATGPTRVGRNALLPRLELLLRDGPSAGEVAEHRDLIDGEEGNQLRHLNTCPSLGHVTSIRYDHRGSSRTSRDLPPPAFQGAGGTRNSGTSPPTSAAWPGDTQEGSPSGCQGPPTPRRGCPDRLVVWPLLTV